MKISTWESERVWRMGKALGVQQITTRRVPKGRLCRDSWPREHFPGGVCAKHCDSLSILTGSICAILEKCCAEWELGGEGARAMFPLALEVQEMEILQFLTGGIKK